jgi:UDP-N-acetylglucosamine 2-epimerase (non-hydrolysing)
MSGAEHRIAIVVGARPNFMKAAPVLRELTKRSRSSVRLVNTGQHYDEAMAGSFLRDLGFPIPDVDLGVGSGSHARQTAEAMHRFEEWLESRRQELVIVVGDVNSTVATALTAVKLHVPVAHVEAGLRSFDRTMPEEINRLTTDAVSSLLFVTEPSGVENLRREGARMERVALVGNTMIDTLERFRERARARPPPAGWPARYGVVTLHRPANVDRRETLAGIVEALAAIARDLPLVWPIHPRTAKHLDEFGLTRLLQSAPQLQLVSPLGYVDFLAAMTRAALILTDSGGIQEEALVLRVPVVTLRENTERPVTIECGGNALAGSDPRRILAAAREMLARDPAQFRTPELWDGRAAERIADRIELFFREGGGL